VTVEERSILQIRGGVDDFAYLSSPQSSLIKDVKDAEEFRVTRDCLESVGVDGKTMMDIFKLISGILQLGNVNFLGNDAEGNVTGIQDSSKDSLERTVMYKIISNFPHNFLLTETEYLHRRPCLESVLRLY
jgi:myosin heavy subunit